VKFNLLIQVFYFVMYLRWSVYDDVTGVPGAVVSNTSF
jgi:hypothetical protein